MSKKPSRKLILPCAAIVLGACALVLTFSSARAEPTAKPTANSAAAPVSAFSESVVGWEKVGTKDGVESYKKEIEGDPVVALRGEGVIEAPLVRVASVILDDGRAKEWVDSLAESRLLKMYSPREFLEYTHIGTPFVLKDRDFLTRGDVTPNLGEKSITMHMYSVEDPLMPPGKYVRGSLDGYWKMRSLENGTKTYVTAEMHADPKGSVPKWIVNLFQKGWARETILSLRKQVAKPDIAIVPEVTKMFPAKP